MRIGYGYEKRPRPTTNEIRNNPATKLIGCNAPKYTSLKRCKLPRCAGNSTCVLACKIAAEEYEGVVLSLIVCLDEDVVNRWNWV